jgi:hypothetical protein
MASNAWLWTGDTFPETTGFMIAMQNRVISTNVFKRCILKDISITNDILRTFQEKSETIQHITGECSALAQGSYTPSSQSSDQHCASNVEFQRDQQFRIRNKSQSLLEKANYRL